MGVRVGVFESGREREEWNVCSFSLSLSQPHDHNFELNLLGGDF